MAAALLIPLILTAVQQLGSMKQGEISAEVTREVAAMEAGLLNEAIQMQEQFLTQSRGDIAEAVKQGRISLQDGFSQAVETLQPLGGSEDLNKALSLVKDPGGVSELPTTQAQVGQGEGAISALTSKVSGGGVSPATTKAAEDRGQNIASTRISEALNRLMPGVRREARVASTLSGLQRDLGISLTDLGIEGTTGMSDVTSRTVPSIASNMVASGDVRSGELIDLANIQTGQVQSGINTAAQLAELFASR